jgi:hypothetical protein
MRRVFRPLMWVRAALVLVLFCILSRDAWAQHSTVGKPGDESAGQFGTAKPADADLSAFQSFNAFAQEWMAKLAEAQEFQRREQIKVRKSGSLYVAEYRGYDRRSAWVGVKRTHSTVTPYVGRLFYHEWNFRCVANSLKAALKGPFTPVQGEMVEEIFRFTGGKWIY